jgi:UDPglucose--hexose-1-phosphate uridylyltransferase
MTERRYDPTVGEWRLFSPHRPDAMPDNGQCRFCPTRDPDSPTDVPVESYQLAVLDDPFPALSVDADPPSVSSDRIYQVWPATGVSEVFLYSDQHGAKLSDLEDTHIARLIDVWADRYAALGARAETGYVYIFEDGTVQGVTEAHPYGRIHAYPDIPPLVNRELRAAEEHQRANGTCLFCDVVAYERTDGRRVVVADDDCFVAYVPFAARFPFEVHVYSQRHITSVLDCTDPERLALARTLQAVVRSYRARFGPDVAYAMSVHQAPTDDGAWLAVSHLHVEFAPVSRLAAPELGAGAFISDCLPERAAAELRAALTG